MLVGALNLFLFMIDIPVTLQFVLANCTHLDVYEYVVKRILLFLHEAVFGKIYLYAWKSERILFLLHKFRNVKKVR